MLELYTTLKFVHVLGAITWLGGSAAVGVMTARAASARDRGALAAIVRQGGAYGARFGAPAMLLVLLTGMGMVGTGHLGFRQLWILWGLGGVVAHFLFGVLLLRGAIVELATLAGDSTATDSAVYAASRRVSMLTYGYLTMLASVVAMMIFKPTL